MYRHTSFYCASQVLHLFFTNERPDPSSAKDYDSLYCNIDFIVVVWNQTHNVSKVCLYICKFMPVFDYYLTKIYDMIWDEMRYMICDVMWYDVMWHYMSYDMITLSEGIYQAICSEERSASSVSWMSLSLPLSLEEVNFSPKSKTTLKQEAKVTSPHSLLEPYAGCTQTPHRTGKHAVLQMCRFYCCSVFPKWLLWGHENVSYGMF